MIKRTTFTQDFKRKIGFELATGLTSAGVKYLNEKAFLPQCFTSGLCCNEHAGNPGQERASRNAQADQRA